MQYEFKDPINQKLAQTYSKMVSESHTAKEIAATPTPELRKLAKTYERSASDHGVKHDAAVEAGEKDKAAMLKKKMLDHADEAMDIRAEIRKRIGK